MDNLQKHNTSELKRFALTMAWAFPLFFSLLLPWLFNYNYQVWPMVVTGGLLTLYLVWPKGLFYPYKVWMSLAGIIGWVNTRLVLGVCFYVMLLPLGLVLKLFGKLQYKNKVKGTSNYRAPEAKSDKQSLEYPF
ncbi:hypothetical protein J1N51_13170 [Psychrosphaera ytuae]|uniref:SxtJ n=1 Tax=Psychrosphaera ytuae TaxID=2820710 RepID=A0A975DDH7_9GAMM|nr:SxtJ family membrane protein [Psychrosphaera ytuae]QTH63655.1 hypothetical protein J1N51_13170 [Psychrosphaera ytuae]